MSGQNPQMPRWTKNHYGVTIYSDVPVTGVIQNNSVEWLHEEICNGIDLNHAEHYSECKVCQSDEHCEESEMMECGDTLIGSWKKDHIGRYIPDESGEYAAIVRECVTQVVWSKHTTRVRSLCSPCYPGQADLDSGEASKFPNEGHAWLCYTLPPDIIGTREEN